MILVAGLAIAGLAGIAAAFYFSMRPDGSRARTVPGSRGRGPARTGDSQRPASRSRTSRAPTDGSDRSASPARSARSAGGARSESGRASDRTGSSGSSTVIDFTGPQRMLEDPEPTVTGHRARHEPDDSAATSRSRRRVGWRKGSDVDEELWPVEEFGGVSDEQFWDDLATDKPLATTARTARPRHRAHRPARHRAHRPARHRGHAAATEHRTGYASATPSRPGRPDRDPAGSARPSAFGDLAGRDAALPGGDAAGADRHPAGSCRPSARRVARPVAYQRGGGPADQPGVLAEAQGKRRRPCLPVIAPLR